ncbi:MAG: tetratricopeptide repeat protein [Candidatus Sericytochromatia bacterium]|nr:tetratricopeptide repeat protein [Candidatus Sericytochromatia bacterium]
MTDFVSPPASQVPLSGDASLSSPLTEARMALETGDWPTAETLYEAILQTLPTGSEAWALAGIVALQLGNPTLAAERLAQARIRQPDDALTLVWLGQALAFSGQLAAALEPLETACGLAPTLYDAHHAWGTVLVELKRPLEAIRPLMRAVKLNPAAAPTWLTLGLALAATGEDEAAVGAMAQVIACQPEDATGYHEFARHHLANGRPELAKPLFMQACALAPGDAQLHSDTSGCFDALGDMEAAVRHYDRACDLDPTFA